MNNNDPVKSSFRLTSFLAKTAVVVFFVLVVFMATILAAGWRMFNEAKIGRVALSDAANAATRLDFLTTVEDLKTARTHLSAANRFGVLLAPLSFLPYFGNDIKSARILVDASLKTATALERIASLGNGLVEILSHSGDLDLKTPTVSDGVIAFFRLSPDDRLLILEKLSQSPSQLAVSIAEIDRALEEFNFLPETRYLTPVVASLKPIMSELESIRHRFVEAAELSRLLSALSGYPNIKKYLLLFQNNTELRPTGGFIGALGNLTVANATISDFRMIDVYAIDTALGENLTIPPPAPLRKYLGVNKWHLRDANWSPDVPTAVEKVMEFYNQQGGSKDMDGVVAIDPTLAEDLLQIVGNIKIGESIFTSENVTDEIEYQVEKGFDVKGLPIAQRKDILILLAGEVFNRVIALPNEKWQLVIDALIKALDQKHLLIVSFDPTVAEFAKSRNWDGALRQNNGDFLMVVDANLAAFKTDSVMSRTVSYSIKPDDKGLVATVKLKYSNHGSFTWKTTRYRTYTRIYVPMGSELISSTGAMLNDKIIDPRHTPGSVDIVDELGRRSFGAFLSVEPKKSGELTFTYRLPSSIATSVSLGDYSLLVQKQAGTNAVPLTLDLDFGKRVLGATPAEDEKYRGNGVYNVSTDLTVDRDVKVSF